MHRIQKQILEITFATHEDATQQAFAWQQRTGELVREQLSPKLESLFDRYAGSSNRVLRLDRLEIAVQGLRMDNWEEQLVEKIVDAMEAALQNQRKGAQNEAPGSEHNRFIPTEEVYFEAFTYFLQGGVLPWWAEFKDFGDFQQAVLRALQKSPGYAYQPQLLKTLRHPPAIERLLGQFLGEVIAKIIRLLASPSDLADFEQLKKTWTNAFRGVSEAPGLTEPPLLPDLSFFLQELVWGERKMTDWAQAWLAWVQKKRPDLLLPLLLTQFEQLWQEEIPGWRVLPQLKESLTPPDAAESKPIRPDTTDAEAKSSPKTTNEEKSEEAQGLYVQNAGLVLLYPFLQKYVEACGFAQADTLAHPLAAVHALQYLVTAQQQTPEYELPLNKLLCGLPLSATVPLEVELTASIRQEAEQLLHAVIGYWSILKSTSPDGLRESFLKRLGKLSPKEEGDWLLQVEQQSYDLLLEHLPWAYSPMRLPWMTGTLWVEWG